MHLTMLTNSRPIISPFSLRLSQRHVSLLTQHQRTILTTTSTSTTPDLSRRHAGLLNSSTSIIRGTTSTIKRTNNSLCTSSTLSSSSSRSPSSYHHGRLGMSLNGLKNLLFVHSIRGMSDESLRSQGASPPKHFMSRDGAMKAPKTDIAKKEMDEHWESETHVNLPHPVWSSASVQAVRETHYRPNRIHDLLAFFSVKALRQGFDLISGYSLGLVDENGWLNRIIFLETVAGVPGLVAAMVRHLRSLRRMERDYGWIHTLLEEAENERMHLMTALQLKQPGLFFRLFVLFTQGIFLPFFTTAYLISPKYAHRFVGYLEEEAVHTYTHLLDTIRKGELPVFSKLSAPLIAKQYWELADDASFEDLIYAIRADESHHRDVNHTFASMDSKDPNPFGPGA